MTWRMWGPGLPAEGVPERGYTVNGDDHDRILNLEKALNDPKDGIIAQLADIRAEVRGGVRLWAIALGLIASVAGTVVTNKLTAPAASPDTEALTKAVEQLETTIRERQKVEASR